MSKTSNNSPLQLSDEVKLFITQGCACFDPPSVVADAVKQEFGVVIARQIVESYDPTKKAGRNLGKKLRAVFEATRKTFLDDTSQIPGANKAVRLRALDRMARTAESSRNYPLAAQLYEQIAKEVGDSYTNKQKLEHTGKDGGPMETRSLSDEQVAAKLAELAAKAKASG